ncbi:MAG TPA: glycine C-acetyltransferase [Armatimonadota bacterium]|jgi:glycine C-acetyltransferase|nr:glycine C-acetyltransferase [Armatimonadota bacterium]
MTQKAMDFIDDLLQALKDKGLYRQFRVLEGEQLPLAKFDGREVVNLSSNNYLGLNTHPRLRAAAIKAVEELGAGSGAVRTIAGTMSIHEELERRLAEFKHTEATLVLQSGFAANQGVLGSILEEGDLVISDELNHASIIDGLRLTKATRKIYPHSDMDGLKDVLEESKDFKKKLIVTDGVFSMDGDIAPLPQIVELAEQYEAIVMVDDAHSSGVLGKNGRGSINHFGLDGRVDIQVGTLSKAMGVMGGYMAGSQRLRELMIHRARPLLFSTSHPPAVAAACIAAIDVLLDEPELIQKLWDNAAYFKDGLNKLGFNTGHSETPITPVIVGKGDLAMKLSDRLFAEGVFAQGIGYPTVPEAKSRVRTIVTATHTKAMLDRALETFEKVGKELAII